jgi:hypothetical protein
MLAGADTPLVGAGQQAAGAGRPGTAAVVSGCAQQMMPSHCNVMQCDGDAHWSHHTPSQQYLPFALPLLQLHVVQCQFPSSVTLALAVDDGDRQHICVLHTVIMLHANWSYVSPCAAGSCSGRMAELTGQS